MKTAKRGLRCVVVAGAFGDFALGDVDAAELDAAGSSAAAGSVFAVISFCGRPEIRG